MISKALRVGATLLTFGSSAIGQTASRAGEIQAAREAKARDIQPEVPSALQKFLETLHVQKIAARFNAGAGGFRIKTGGLLTNQGFALGPEYRRNFLNDRIVFHGSARGSLQKAYLMDLGLEAPRLADDRLFADFHATHFDYPKVEYYGPGPKSQNGGHSVYRLEDTAFDVRTGVRPIRRLSLGATGRYLLVNVGPGVHDEFVSAGKIYTEETTPGISRQTNFLRGGVFAQYDYRDNPDRPRSGGNYIAQVFTYSDRELHRNSFNRLDLEAQQYLSFFNGRRTLALRGRSILTDPHHGQVVPFYLQPYLGGGDDLRGFPPFRFYDSNSILFNAEYRWAIFNGLDMALFADTGKVFHRMPEWNIHHMEADFGFGFRPYINGKVAARIDVGFSHEGYHIWLKFENIF